jgi:hypothetical protein
MANRHPALTQLDVLVGRWTVQPKVDGLGAGWSEFTWRENSPLPTTALIGLDDTTGEFTMLYADARGVHRVYRMTLVGDVWTVWRDAPGFNQRFTGTMSADGNRIDGRWEMSKDGETWNLDFELSYVRR